MSRYRPPRPRSSPYITREGYDALQQELSHLWKVKRPEVTKKVSEAAAQGDRSENAEYIYGKRQLREIDGRIKFLSQRLDVVEVVDRPPPEQDKVFFGAFVTLEDLAGEAHKFRIVGADEIDQSKGHISIDAPLARAMIGKQLDAEIDIEEQASSDPPRILRVGHVAEQFSYVITDISYAT